MSDNSKRWLDSNESNRKKRSLCWNALMTRETEVRRRRNEETDIVVAEQTAVLSLVQYVDEFEDWAHPLLLRQPRSINRRLDLISFLSSKKEDPLHTRRIRMNHANFIKLLGLVEGQLELSHPDQAQRRGGVISPAVCLYGTLRYLAGGMYICICDHVGISQSSFYRVLHKTLRALIKCKTLDMRLPSTADECQELANKFSNISYKQAIGNCVGALDGYVMKIKTPSSKVVGNVKSFFSGHYHFMAINVQAVVDSDCRFLHLSMCAPGSASDRVAVSRKDSNNGGMSLLDMIEMLPDPFVVVADSAYPATEHCIPQFGYPQNREEGCSNYNFFGSQLRMRVEMAFGIMVNRWGILHKALMGELSTVKLIILAIARIHNFVIGERILLDVNWNPQVHHPQIAGAAMDVVLDEDENNVAVEDTNDVEGLHILNLFCDSNMRKNVFDCYN